VITDSQIAPYKALLWPSLRAVREIGDSGTIEEIVEKVIELEGFTEQQQSVVHGEGPSSEIEYRLAWARTYLKGMGALINSTRGVWSTTELGRQLTEEQVVSLHAEYVVELRAARRKKRIAAAESDVGGVSDTDIGAERDWKEQLLETLLAVPPNQFERLARRLLREAGFISATVTGKSGDGGIDGIGVYRLSLVSFPVFFQCKRYRGSVGAGAVRDFRGAMSGRGDKGLLITTGNFTAEAMAEATRDGAPPIDLIDGERLCDLLKDYELGVRRTIRQIEDVEVLPEFFDAL
jgi:restriction system protein